MLGEVLFDELSVLLEDLLGTYLPIEFPSVSFDAINLGSDTPPGFEVTGLEVLIAKSPAISSRPVIGGSVLNERTINILLRQWDSDGKTTPAIERVVRRYPQSSVGALVPATRDTLEQVTIYLISSEILAGI